MKTPLNTKAKVSISHYDHEGHYLMIPCLGTLLQDHRVLLSEGLEGTMSETQPWAGFAGECDLTWRAGRGTGGTPHHLLQFQPSHHITKSFYGRSRTRRLPFSAGPCQALQGHLRHPDEAAARTQQGRSPSWPPGAVGAAPTPPPAPRAHHNAQEDAEMCGKRGSICQRSGGCVLLHVYPPTYLLRGLKELFLMQKET